MVIHSNDKLFYLLRYNSRKYVTELFTERFTNSTRGKDKGIAGQNVLLFQAWVMCLFLAFYKGGSSFKEK